MTPKPLPLATLDQAFEGTPLFEDKSWQRSPAALPLSQQQHSQIEAIGQACLDFYLATDLLYNKSSQNKSLLRNETLLAPWVADIYNAGKPEELIKTSAHKAFKAKLPPLIRPDLLITDSGFTLTELDSTPGAYGVTTFLYNLYNLPHSMPELFQSAVNQDQKIANPATALLVSDESATYRPEHHYLAQEIQKLGYNTHCLQPSELIYKENGVFAQINDQMTQIQTVFRFFELFDLPNFPNAEKLLDSAKRGHIELTPPPKPHHEEKLSLALFHHPILQPFWQEAIPGNSLKILQNIIPKSYILDPTPVPPNAQLLAPASSWEALGKASQKNRNFIIKISGYHESAWGARSITLGPDVPQTEWHSAIESALNAFPKHPHVLQVYHKPKSVYHPIYEKDGSIVDTPTRIRLCPYYTHNYKSTTHAGTLATLCPNDKKIIHGMEDAALVPTA